MHGAALTLLRLGEAAIRASAARATPAWRRDAGGTHRTEAGGKCLFECGPPALDLVTADARTLGIGRAVLHGVMGTRLATSLAFLAAKRDLACLLVHRAGTDEIDPVLPDGWVATVPTPEGPVFFSGALGTQLPDALPACLRDADLTAEAGSLVLAAAPATPVVAPVGATDWTERVAAAYRMGTDVDPLDYRHLYALEMQTWAPTSERSRAQAGYGRY